MTVIDFPATHTESTRTAESADPSKKMPRVLTIRHLADAMTESTGHEVRSDYVERFWLPILGPTSTWLLRRFVRGLDSNPAGVRVDAESTGRSVGLGGGLGRTAPFARAVDRLRVFGALRWIDDTTLAVRTHLGPLSDRQLARLPESTQRAHATFCHQAAELADLERAVAIAGCLDGLGDDPDSVIRQLNRWGFDPHTAHAAGDVVYANAAVNRARELHPSNG